MPRILICECKQEVSSFNPVLGLYSDFAVQRGQALLDYHHSVRNEVGGALSVFEATPGVEIVPGYGCRGITSGGTMAGADFARLASEFLAEVKAARDLDAVYFSLHGALAATDVEDCEGHLLAETRKIVGERIPIVTSLDLHGILTDKILEHSNAVVPYHTYPHVDFFETGVRSAKLLLRILSGDAKPVSIRVPIPAMVRGYELITETGMFGRCVRRTIAFENGPGLCGGMFIGNPFTDVTDLCSNVLLTANGDETEGMKEAISIAREFWTMREHLQQPLTELEESIRIAAAAKGRVVLVDAADATSSGAPGDSNAIARELIRQGCTRTALVPVVDEPAVKAAFRAGVGNRMTTPIGGTLDPKRHAPLVVEGKVRVLSDGDLVSESHGERWFAGPSAVIQSGSITYVLSSRPVSLYDRTIFLANGQDPHTFDMTVVKSPHCQPRFFADGAERLINVDAPGATSANLPYLGHTRCARPVFPLDPGVEFEPKARIFRRG